MLKVNRFFKAKPVWLSAAALLISLSTFIPFYQDNKAYAYMSIDANPSIELGVNKKMQVVELTGFNKEGKQVISHLNDWKKTDVSSLAEVILTEIKKEGYLKNNNHVIISTVRTEQPETDVEQRLKENIKEIKTSVHDEKLNLTFVSGTEEELEKAHKLGITAGKLQVKDNQRAKEKVNSNVQQNEYVPDGSSNQANIPGQIKKQQGQNSVQGMKNQSVKTGIKVPPGQMKKESTQDAQDRKIKLENNGKVNPQPQKEKNSLPPGQLKKMDEEKVKHDQEQKKILFDEHSNQRQQGKNTHDFKKEK